VVQPVLDDLVHAVALNLEVLHELCDALDVFVEQTLGVHLPEVDCQHHIYVAVSGVGDFEFVGALWVDFDYEQPLWFLLDVFEHLVSRTQHLKIDACGLCELHPLQTLLLLLLFDGLDKAFAGVGQLGHLIQHYIVLQRQPLADFDFVVYYLVFKFFDVFVYRVGVVDIRAFQKGVY